MMRTTEPKTTTDYLYNHDNAEQLALKIRRYWLTRGWNVSVWIVEHHGLCCVRSDLENGLPA